ncbi:unnamed protein product [Prunus armeniaca]|uniref:Uncharacterized protein n=1 Tax=Prunus armeniaca TaxID=36596 RepID=A0A6J5Y9V5_PRUAR|nr:unnamed protein product [Prunus armeniaca]
MNSVDPIRVCFPSRRPQMDETKNATQGARTQRGGGPDKARAKQRDGASEKRECRLAPKASRERSKAINA